MKILLGITGSIAAYKALDILRILKKNNEDVICVFTKEATQFVAPLSFSILSQKEVITDLFSYKTYPEHIELATCDVILIAPATYNFINKIANGIADDPLSCAIAATKATVIFSPCMDTNMWNNPILQENIKKLTKLGYHFIEPEEGHLSTLKIGKGRLPAPEFIVDELYCIMNKNKNLYGKKIVITAGRTLEFIDPVRCITNKSSGKMGYELARQAKLAGGNVILIAGETNIPPPQGIKFIKINTTSELRNAVISETRDADILIMAAAVSDYRPEIFYNKKIKNEKLEIKLAKTEDILKEVRKKYKKLFIVGFSLETENIIKNAKNKLKDKGIDMIIANNAETLGSDYITPAIIDKKFNIKKLPKLTKIDAAKKIIEHISSTIAI